MKKILYTAFVLLLGVSAYAQLTVKVSVPGSLQPSLPPAGRMLIYFYEGDKPDPVNSIMLTNPQKTGFRFGKDLVWNGIKPAEITGGVMGSRKNSFIDLDTGTYHVQAIYDIDTTTYRLHTWPNLYSTSKKIYLSKKGKQTVEIILDKQFERPEYKDGRYTKFVSIKSNLLSKFWKRDIVIRALVALPPDFDSSGPRKYPVAYDIGGYGTDCKYAAFYGPDSAYIKQWNNGQPMDIIKVFLDSDAPYGDSYQMNSENNGPYMDALIKELIPAIEQRFHGYGTPESRFLTGGSTGGWVSLALQVFNPDFFNGCWSFYSDPVDFNFFQLVNIYKDENAFVNRYQYLNPSMRSVYGEPRLSIKDEVTNENSLGRNNSYVFSGDQWGGWNAVYSPKGKNGQPAAILDPVTGKIDTAIAAYWKKWDLHLYLEKNWKELGPKLQGKIHIWMGDMDTYYLNNAMRLFQAFLSKTENPRSDAKIEFGAMKVHGWEPLSEFERLKQMRMRFDSTAKKSF